MKIHRNYYITWICPVWQVDISFYLIFHNLIMFSISFAITYIVILTCVMFLNLIISLSVLWIDNDIIAYIALQKQPPLFRGYLTTKRGLFYSPFFCYHSISLYVCKSIYFFMIRLKFYAGVFSSVYFLYTWRSNLLIPVSVPRPSQTNIPLPAIHQ